MGCGASTHAASSAQPLEEWDRKEVEKWFADIPRVSQYRERLLPDDGCAIAIWDKQFLVRKGIPEDDAARIIAYRDKASRAAAASASPASAAQSIPPGELADTPAPDPAATDAARGGPTPATAGTLPLAQRAEDGSTAADAARGPEAKEEGVYGDDRGVRESLLTLARKGLTFARVALERIGPSLPPPGAEAANLLLQLLNVVDAALVTSDRILGLRNRALAVMDILDAYREELRRVKGYKEVVGGYTEVLQGVLSFVRVYSSRNCLVRLITVGFDAGYCATLESDLAAAGEAFMALIAVNSNARIQRVEAAVCQMAQYRDPAADARVLVAELGGVEALLADNGGKLGDVLRKLGASGRVTLQEATLLLQSHLNKGPQRHIRQPELRLFWAKHFDGEAEVPWFAFWNVFPKLMREMPIDLSLVEKLCALFTDGAAKVAFQRAVARTNKDTVSVWELQVSFSGDDGLLPQVQSLLGGSQEQPVVTSASVGTPNGGGTSATGGTAAPAATTSDQTTFAAHSQLPPLPLSYLGRHEEAAAALAHLESRGSLVLLGPGGMGKSCLAADVGWRLLRGGGAPGGLLWVDLREAASAAEVEARFCAALGLKAEKTDNVSRIVAALGRLADISTPIASPAAAAPCCVLVVVDNAEDALLQQEAADGFRSLLSRVPVEAPASRLLITSRVSLGSPDSFKLAEQPVGAIGSDAAAQLVLGVASDLEADEAAQVAEACHCVPLLLCLVSEALAVGRLALQDVTKRRAQGSSGASSTASMVQVVLASMRRAQQLAAVRMAVFPTSFREDNVALVLEVSEPEARALCAVLYRYSLLQRAGPQRYAMHAVVRQVSLAFGEQLDSSLMKRMEGSFVKVFFRLLSEWGAMYRSAKEGQLALAAARDHTADITRACDLLPAVGEGLALESQLTEDVRTLLSAACLMERLLVPCRVLLAQLESVQPTVVEARMKIATLQWALAWILFSSRQWSAAEVLAQRSWNTRVQLLGKNHPSTLESRTILANCVCCSGRNAESETMYQEVLEARRQVLGAEHPATLMAMNNLANCLNSITAGSGKAELLYREALQLQRRVLGAEHPETLMTINNLANCISSCGHQTEAEQLHREVLEIRRRVLGAEHPETLITLANLAWCVKRGGRHAQAELLNEELQRLKSRLQALRGV